jgi:hypothetical protein
MLEKFKFWKHEEPDLMHQPELPPLQQMEPLPPSQDPNFQQMSQLSNHTSEKDLELIAAKLDVLKAQMDNILQRLDRLERSLQEKPERIRW